MKRVTTVLEDDRVNDVVQDTNSKVKLVGDVVASSREEDIRQWMSDFSDILTEEPG